MTSAERSILFIRNLVKDTTMTDAEKLQYIAVTVGASEVDEIDVEID